MKFYNPFKPHIVEYAPGVFAVRKLPWYFLIRLVDQNYWIYKDYKCKWYHLSFDSMYSLEDAKQLLNYKKPPKFKPKVHTV